MSAPHPGGDVHTMRMSAGCVQIGAGFAHIADAKKLPPPGHPEWGQRLPKHVQELIGGQLAPVRDDWVR